MDLNDLNSKMDSDLLKYTSEVLNIEFKENENLKYSIEQKINELITTDFNQLIYVLYKFDVAENKLKNLLQNNKQIDAAPIITDLIIERLQQKIDTRNQFKNNTKIIPEDEKW